MRIKSDGYPYRWPQPAGAITYQLNGTQVGRGNTLNIQGSGITAIPGNDKLTYVISGGGGSGVVFGDPATGYTPNEIIYVNNFGNLHGDGQFTRDQFTGDTNIGLFNGGNGITIGDSNNQNNGTYVFVNDAAKTLWLYSTEIVQGGNIGLGNNTYFTVDDAQQKFLVSGTWPNTAVADGFSLNFATQEFSIGDVQSNGNNTIFTVNDGGTITAQTNGSFRIQDSSLNKVVEAVTTTFPRVALGDIDSAHNDTTLILDDSIGRLTSNASIHNFGFGFQPNLLYLDYGNATYWIGASGSGNGTSLYLNDGGTDRYAEITANRHFDVINQANHKGLLIDFFNDDYAIGDLDGDLNSNLIWIEDDNNIISARTPGLFHITNPSNAEIFRANILTSEVFLGDIPGTGNGTRITIQDTLTKIAIEAPIIRMQFLPAYADDAAAAVGGLVSGDLYKTTTGGSTFLKIVP